MCIRDSLQTVCIRHEPDGVIDDALDRHTLAWAGAVNAGGAAFCAPSHMDGRWIVRGSIGAEPTERADGAALWELLKRTAAQSPVD